ncbi:hypothetical protein BGV40_09155 [Methanosarcina sp. Ant1]|nr:hypothetical protein BGV40_09155 [Methanosarcina sp. Ant1]
MNVLLELDEDDPDRFYLSGGLKRAIEALKSTFLSLILIVVLFFIWVGVMFWEHLMRRNVVKHIYSSITRIRP